MKAILRPVKGSIVKNWIRFLRNQNHQMGRKSAESKEGSL